MRVVIILSVIAMASSALAQDGPIIEEAFPKSPSDISLGTDPDLWLYLHEQRRMDDPKMAVRRKAEQEAAQRMARLSAQRWFGYSNSRPRAEVTPFMSFYSPYWTGNGYQPGRWYGMGSASDNYYLYLER